MKNNQKIGIFGVGMVGGALKRYFEKNDKYQIFVYDKKGLGSIEELNKADFVYVCLPTPYSPEKGCDISIIEDGIKQLTGEKVVIIKSTVIPGTTQKLQEKFPQHKFLFNPEFLTEATADYDMVNPDRQIIGYTEQSFSLAKEILAQLPLAPYEDIVPCRVAEMIKYANNTWFAVKVAMNNELYDLAKKIGFTEEEWEKTVSGIATDKRVGRTHLEIMHKDKRGYFGKCLPKDIKALLKFAKDAGVEMPVRKATNDYNDKLLNSQDLKEYI
jgi:UDPglucose 6-dehydrogenase